MCSGTRGIYTESLRDRRMTVMSAPWLSTRPLVNHPGLGHEVRATHPVKWGPRSPLELGADMSRPYIWSYRVTDACDILLNCHTMTIRWLTTPASAMKWEPRTHPVQWGPRSPLEHGGADMTGGVAEGPTWRAHMGRGRHDLIPRQNGVRLTLYTIRADKRRDATILMGHENA